MPRKCLPMKAWPQNDRELWQRATKAGRRLLDFSVAAKWRPRTIATVVEAYGYALAWPQKRDQLDPMVAPRLRWSCEQLEAYAHDLSMQLRPATVKNRLLSLERALAVLAPRSDRSALRRFIRCVEVSGDDGRKRDRLQDPDRLVTLDLDLMNRAEQGWHASPRKNAAYFRDGPQIALLALRGFRKGNFASMRIGWCSGMACGGCHFRAQKRKTTCLCKFHSSRWSCRSSIDRPSSLKFLYSPNKISLGLQWPRDVLWAGFLCLHSDLVDQLTCAELQIIWHCEHWECVIRLRNTARIAHDGGELLEESAETVGRRTIFNLL